MSETWQTERLLFAKFDKANLISDDPVAAFGLSAVGPYEIEPGQTLVLAAETGGDQTVTFAGTQAILAGAAADFASIIGGEDLIVEINGVEFVVTFTNADTTVLAVANQINAVILGGAAVVNGTEIDIRSDIFGTDSTVEITGGDALPLLGHSIDASQGTGDVADIDAVTAAEAVAKINSATTNLVADVFGGKVRITSEVLGVTSTVQVKNTSTAADFGFDNTVHTGSDGTIVDSLTAGIDVKAWNQKTLIVTSDQGDEDEAPSDLTCHVEAQLKDLSWWRVSPLLTVPANSAVVHSFTDAFEKVRVSVTPGEILPETIMVQLEGAR